MILAQDREDVVDHLPDLGDVDLDVYVGGSAEREDDVVGTSGVLDEASRLETPAGVHSLQQPLGAGLGERHASRREAFEDDGVPLHPDHMQTAVRKGESERKPDSAKPDDRDAGGDPGHSGGPGTALGHILAKHANDEARVVVEVAGQQATGLLGDAVDPLEAALLHPGRSL